MVSQEQFASAIEKFLSDTGMSPTAFGKAAAGDPTLVFEIRRGRSCSLNLATRITQFMEVYLAGLVASAIERKAS